MREVASSPPLDRISFGRTLMSRKPPTDEPLTAVAEDGCVLIEHAGVALTLSPDAADESLTNITYAVAMAVGQRLQKSERTGR